MAEKIKNKHVSDGITYSEPNGGKFKCKECGKRYNDKEEECLK